VSQREDRLISVGGLISDAFQAAVEEIIDNGSAGYDALVKRITDAVRFKEARILRANGGWESWDAFSADVINQLIDRKAISHISGRYYALEFILGTSYNAIPGPDIMFTVWDEATRLRRDQAAKWLMDVRAAQGVLRVLPDKLAEADPVMLVWAAELVDISSKMEKHLIGNTPEVEEREVEQPRRHATGVKVRTGVAEAVHQYLEEFPLFWVSLAKLADYWNQRNPDQEPLAANDTATMGRALRNLIEAGEVERRGVRGHYEYRKVQ
jgi:hypothetical protein